MCTPPSKESPSILASSPPILSPPSTSLFSPPQLPILSLSPSILASVSLPPMLVLLMLAPSKPPILALPILVLSPPLLLYILLPLLSHVNAPPPPPVSAVASVFSFPSFNASSFVFDPDRIAALSSLDINSSLCAFLNESVSNIYSFNTLRNFLCFNATLVAFNKGSTKSLSTASNFVSGFKFRFGLPLLSCDSTDKVIAFTLSNFRGPSGPFNPSSSPAAAAGGASAPAGAAASSLPAGAASFLSPSSPAGAAPAGAASSFFSPSTGFGDAPPA